MRKITSSAETSPKIPAIVRDLLQDFPLLKSEDRSAYVSLFKEFAKDIKPSGAVEWFWVGDIVFYVWEIIRLRRMKTLIIERTRRSRADRIADNQMRKIWEVEHPNEAAALRLPLKLGDPPRRLPAFDKKELRKRTPKLDTEEDSSSAFEDSMQILEKLEQLLSVKEHRRDEILREIEIHREILARRLRETSTNLIEGRVEKRREAA